MACPTLTATLTRCVAPRLLVERFGRANGSIHLWYDSARHWGLGTHGTCRQVRRILFALILWLIATLQATVFPEINILGIGPNIALVAILVWSAETSVVEGLIWAFLLGIYLDVLALDPLGSHALALLPVVVIGGLARRRVLHSGVILPMVLVVGATIAYQLVEGIIGAVAGRSYPLAVTIRLGVLTALLNMLVVPVLYLFTALLDRLGVTHAPQA